MEHIVTLTDDDLETVGWALDCYYRANRGSSSILTICSTTNFNYYARCERDRIADLAVKLNIPKNISTQKLFDMITGD